MQIFLHLGVKHMVTYVGAWVAGEFVVAQVHSGTFFVDFVRARVEVKELLKDDSTNQCVNVVSFYREVNSLSIKADVCKHMMAQHHSHKDMANGLLQIKMSLKLSPSCTMKELVKYFKTTQARS